MPFFVYIIRSRSSEKYYIGQTNNLDQRLRRHNNGSESATAPYAPWDLAGAIEKQTRAEAVRLEAKLKNLSRSRLEDFMKRHIKK
ncbi:MAG: hypothetical protein RJA57_1975 [Bacteroidota bacterium]